MIAPSYDILLPSHSIVDASVLEYLGCIAFVTSQKYRPITFSIYFQRNSYLGWHLKVLKSIQDSNNVLNNFCLSNFSVLEIILKIGCHSTEPTLNKSKYIFNKDQLFQEFTFEQIFHKTFSNPLIGAFIWLFKLHLNLDTYFSRAGKLTRPIFGGNGNKVICFWDFWTFRKQ